MSDLLQIGTLAHHDRFGVSKIIHRDTRKVTLLCADGEVRQVLAEFLSPAVNGQRVHASSPRQAQWAAPATRRYRQPIVAKAFTWPDAATIPQRKWIYGGHYIRRFVSTTVAHGGVGKSSLVIAEALAIVTGCDLLGVTPADQLPVWLWNGEDPEEELHRRIMAAAKHYGIDGEDYAGGLFVNSGRDTEIVIAEQTKSGTTIAAPVVDAVKATILENDIGLVVIDPFVSSHRVSENDNMAIDAVAKTWTRIADETGCAVELVHHVRKTNGGEITVEDGRGAVALLAAARSARVLNSMTEEEAARWNVENRRIHFRAHNGKSNLALPSERATWFAMVSVPLGNGPLGTDGDVVGVATCWHPPDPLAEFNVEHLRTAQRAVAEGGPWRASVQAKDWVGRPIAEALGLDLDNPADRTKVKALLKTWTATGMFVTVDGIDPIRRDRRQFVEVGTPAND